MRTVTEHIVVAFRGPIRRVAGAVPSWPRLGRGVAVAVLASVVVLIAAVLLAFAVPLPERLHDRHSTVVEYDNGLAAHVFLSEDDRWRIAATREDVDPAYIDALIRFEDKRFYDHWGVDPIAVARAAWLNLTFGRRMSGASTITMQLVRVLEPRDRTYTNKAIEALRAMQIELSDEHELLRQEVRRFAEEVVRPRAQEIDRTGEFPRDFFDRAGELGLAGVAVPEEHGGAGMDPISYCLVIEEISRVCATSGVILSVNNSLVCDPILAFGSDEQKREILTPLASGKKLGCFALTEPGAGSDAAALRTTAKRDGDEYVLDGNKVFITNGTDADVALVFATVDPEKKHKGITAFLVDTDTSGYSHGGHEEKLGVNASGTTELAFEGMRIPASRRLGGEGEGFKIAMATLDGGRIGIAAQAVGIARGAYEQAISYAKEREQFGRPLADLQAIQFYLADMTTELDAARLLTWKAAWAKSHQKRYTLEAAQAKLYAAEIARRVTDTALQIHGGYGYTKDYDVERFFRDARITDIYEGTSEIQKMVIADWVIKHG